MFKPYIHFVYKVIAQCFPKLMVKNDKILINYGVQNYDSISTAQPVACRCGMVWNVVRMSVIFFQKNNEQTTFHFFKRDV
jgi:hypothetical protein